MPRSKQEPLNKHYDENYKNNNILEIGIDEAGRGPLFGRVYTAAVVLPKDDDFDFSKMKDSKKFSSEKKITEVAEYIKENAISWAVTYNDEKTIDKINIRQCVLTSMHESIKSVISKLSSKNASNLNNSIDCNDNNSNISDNSNYFLLVDGNDFKPYMRYTDDGLMPINHICIEGGDNKYCAIAAASILAKTERDKYINELCEENPELIEKYSIDKNKGYGTKKHLDGIKNNGISKWHRKTYGICKDYC
tara:strand:- start:12 stop:758 length:747 start_codon:yes stop_codon:yes gene_type:complete